MDNNLLELLLVPAQPSMHPEFFSPQTQHTCFCQVTGELPWSSSQLLKDNSGLTMTAASSLNTFECIIYVCPVYRINLQLKSFLMSMSLLWTLLTKSCI